MKTKIYSLLFLVLLFSAVLPVSSQQNTSTTTAYTEGFEKLYVQTDKTLYTQEETIWYKAFLVNASDNKPSSISEVVYVELHDPKGTVLTKQELLVKDGTCNGEIKLNKEHAGGLYKLIAYTRWMSNQQDEPFFEKEITIQKVITPRLLLKLEFEKRAYGGGDEVEALLNVTDLNNLPANDATVKAAIRLAGNQVQTVDGQTEQGSTSIRFKLPDQLSSADGILQVLVDYNGVNESITRSIPIVLNRIKLGFYPEGGEMINGFYGKVAFKALNEFGKGADVSGEIIDQDGNILTSFHSYHLGMGAFELLPEEGKKYFARITRPAGNNEKFPLPLSRHNRYGIKLENSDEKKTVWTIYAPEETNNARLKATTHGIIHYEETLHLSRGLNKIEVNTTGFPAGIAVFTLSDEYQRGQCERLVFINSFKTLQINLETDEKYIPGKNGTIKITTTDEEGNPVSALLGLAIVDEQLMTFANNKQDHIVSYLLMSSDLKGDIEEPSFYFDEKEPKSEKGLDYLLLTQGWRQFTWEELGDPVTDRIIEVPEKVSSINGMVKDKIGYPVEGAEVYLIEIYGKRRIARVKTNQRGQFTFQNVDISTPISLATLLPNHISFDFLPPLRWEEETLHKDNTGNFPEENIPELISIEPVQELQPRPQQQTAVNESIIPSDYLPGFFNDVAVLDDVVIVGYGTEKRSNVTGAVINRRDKYNITYSSLNSLLTGSMSGLKVIPASNPVNDQLVNLYGYITPGSSPGLQIVVDGLPVYHPFPKVFSYINPAMVSGIYLYKTSGGSAKYGNQGANGILKLETYTKKGNYYTKYPKSPYAIKDVEPRRFYSPERFNTTWDNRELLSPTVHWEGMVRTDEKGKAIIQFTNNKNTSSFRITAEGLSPSTGLIGHATHQFITEQPLSIDIKVPVMAALKDRIRIPVLVRNTTGEEMDTTIDFIIRSQHTDSSRENVVYSKKYTATVSEYSTQTVYIPIPEVPVQGLYSIVIRVSDQNSNTAQMIRSIMFRETNFPMSAGFSGKGTEAENHIDIPDYVPGTLQAELSIYSSVLDELLDGVENIFRAPYGCFEQVSSSTMPNIFALQLLNSSGQTNEYIRDKATGYLRDGYNKLAAYEIKGGGFEWFGKPPAHQVLSAYGLVEFTEMAKVYSGVNKNLISRTVQYLMNERDGNGGFKHNRGKYGFSGVPDAVGNAYIVYAMTESGYGEDISKEYDSALKEVLKSKDLYRMALLANAAYAKGDKTNYDTLIDYFRTYLKNKNFDSIKPQATIVYSSYPALETAAFWLLALLKDNETYDALLVDKCVNYISKGRKQGGYGNTQTTSLCLQALARFVEKTSIPVEEASFEIKVNGNTYTNPILKHKKTTEDITSYLQKGNNKIDLTIKDSKKGYSYSVDMQWYSEVPPSSKECPLELTTRLASPSLKVNETVRLNITLKNKENEGKPMSIAVIGIPGGMSLQPWQLKELQDKEVYDYYEIVDENLVIYFREMGPKEIKTINLDLKAEIPGTYYGVASSAYLYYTNNHKHWIPGLEVKINQATQ